MAKQIDAVITSVGLNPSTKFGNIEFPSKDCEVSEFGNIEFPSKDCEVSVFFFCTLEGFFYEVHAFKIRKSECIYNMNNLKRPFDGEGTRTRIWCNSIMEYHA